MNRRTDAKVQDGKDVMTRTRLEKDSRHIMQIGARFWHKADLFHDFLAEGPPRLRSILRLSRSRDGTMPDVFISYSVKDEQLAQFVRSHLLNHQLDVFLASLSLNKGEHWTPQIIEALRYSEWVFLLASKNALASANVQQEIGGAIFNKKKLIPIMWDVEPSELPRWVADYQGLTLKGKTLEEIQAQVAQLAAQVKANKTNMQLVAGAVFAGLLLLLAKS